MENMKMKNRELKFRAWHNGTKTMHYTTKEKTVWVGGQGASVNLDNLGVQLFNTDMVMQFTGLKDKTGKEIYEGDIIETWRRVGRGYKENYVEQVHFSEITARWYPLDITVTEKCEVLGNIFEHPHLVEKAKTDQV